MSDSIVTTITLCAVITIAVRALPIVLLAGARLPPFALNWLSFIPSSIMTAIVTLELVRHADQPGGMLATLIAAGASIVVAIVSRSLFGTVMIGIVAYLAVTLLT